VGVGVSSTSLNWLDAAIRSSEWEDGSHLEASTSMLAEIGIEVNEATLHRFPQLMRLEPKQVEETALFLRSELTEPVMHAVVRASPELLGYKVGEHLVPGLKFMRTMMGANAALPASALIMLEPTLLGWSIEESIRERRVIEAVKAAAEQTEKEEESMMHSELGRLKATLAGDIRANLQEDIRVSIQDDIRASLQEGLHDGATLTNLLMNRVSKERLRAISWWMGTARSGINVGSTSTSNAR